MSTKLETTQGIYREWKRSSSEGWSVGYFFFVIRGDNVVRHCPSWYSKPYSGASTDLQDW